MPISGTCETDSQSIGSYCHSFSQAAWKNVFCNSTDCHDSKMNHAATQETRLPQLVEQIA